MPSPVSEALGAHRLRSPGPMRVPYDGPTRLGFVTWLAYRAPPQAHALTSTFSDESFTRSRSTTSRRTTSGTNRGWHVEATTHKSRHHPAQVRRARLVRDEVLCDDDVQVVLWKGLSPLKPVSADVA